MVYTVFGLLNIDASLLLSLSKAGHRVVGARAVHKRARVQGRKVARRGLRGHRQQLANGRAEGIAQMHISIDFFPSNFRAGREEKEFDHPSLRF